jgi:hypothetical protein
VVPGTLQRTRSAPGKPVALAAKSVGVISETILKEPGKLEEKEVKKAVALLSSSN